MYVCLYVCMDVFAHLSKCMWKPGVYVECHPQFLSTSSFETRSLSHGLVRSSMPPEEADDVLLFLFVKFPLDVRKGNDFPKCIGLFASHTHLCSLAVGHLSTKEGEKCHLAPFCLFVLLRVGIFNKSLQ